VVEPSSEFFFFNRVTLSFNDVIAIGGIHLALVMPSAISGIHLAMASHANWNTGMNSIYNY